MSRSVVLLPSLGRGAADFDRLAADLARARFEPHAIEPPASFAGEPTLHDLAADVLATLDSLGLGGEPFHLVGHAFGQRLARCVAADAPGRIESLTMLAAGGHVPMPADVARSLVACFDESLGDDEHIEHVRRVFFAPGNDPEVWRGGWLPDVAAYQMAAVRRTEADDWLGASAPRVLVVQGLQDTCAVPENGRAYVATHPDIATLVELDAAGHALLPERPEAVADAVVDFLS